jgi:hypothetical protein
MSTPSSNRCVAKEWRSFGAALTGRQPGEGALFTLVSPLVEMRRVEALPPQQGADLAALDAGIGLFQNAFLILLAEMPACGSMRHLRIGNDHAEVAVAARF